MRKIEITEEEYKQIAYALHFTSYSEAKPPRYHKYKWDFANLRHRKFDDVGSFHNIEV